MSNKEPKNEIKKIIDFIINHTLMETNATLDWRKRDKLTEQSTQSITTLLDQKIKEARIDEWRPLTTAKINFSAKPAPFNPNGLPVNTPETQEMTKLLHKYAEDRISALKGEQ